MPTLVYAVFADAAAADEATVALTRTSPEFPAFPVQLHSRGPLDGGDLPESATEVGRNTIIGTIFGAGVGLALGLFTGLRLDIMGVTPAIGAIMGLVTGTLSGALRGLMAGTRVPKQSLSAAAAALEDGAVLMTIDVIELRHVAHVETLLESHGAEQIDRC